MALCVAAGCQSARVGSPLTGSVGGNAPEQQMEFWHQLAERPVTSNDEAFHGMLIFTDGQDPASDYAGRVDAMRARRMLPSGFNAPPERAVDRGTLAVAMVRALAIKGGWVMHAFGPSPRYAVKEMQFLNLYPPSSPNQTFSGGEFLAVLSKAEEYQRAHGKEQRTADFGNTEVPVESPQSQESAPGT
jgi:hypothetical protein